MKIAIVCGSPSFKDAPFDDNSWQIWGLGNQLHRFEGRRIDRLFEIHEDLSEHDERYPQWLVDHKIPLVVSDKFPIKQDNSIVFDYAKASKMIGDYFTSSAAVMIAQAIMDGAKEIGIWGVDMAVDDHEYYKQRPCMEAWIGYARGRGINVSVADSSPVGRSDYREGRDWRKDREAGIPPFTNSELLSMARQHQEAIKVIDEKIRVFQLNRAAHDGSVQTYERLAKVARAVESGNKIQSLSDGVVLSG